MSTLKVDAIRHNSATSDAITTAADGTCTARITGMTGGGQLSHRNLIINGAMMISQRATSSTSSGYRTLDRYKAEGSNTGQTATQSQQDLSSSDTPYTLGFRKYMRIALASGGTANANAAVEIQQRIEAQNIANSGWNVTSSSSNITLSFWFRPSTNQTFYGYFYSFDGTAQVYTFSFTASGNNTWTKITKTIPGNSNLTIDNNNGAGLQLKLMAFYGTDYSNNKTLDQWAANDGANQLPDMASTWLTTGTPTFDITGVQLEVGDTATTFEHRSFGEELSRCHRYYNKVYDVEGQSGEKPFLLGTYLNSSELACVVQFPKMRAVPSLDISNGTNVFMIRRNGASDNFNTFTMRYGTTTTAELYVSSNVSGTGGQCGIIRGADTNIYIAFSAEL